MPVLKVICHQDPRFARMSVPKYHDDEALESVISYCQDFNKTATELVGGFGINVSQAAYEMDLLAHAYGKQKGLRLRHWILSFTDEEVRKVKRIDRKVYPELKKFAWYAAAYYGSQYQIVFAVHTDSHCPHIHFVMNTVSYRTGLKYDGKKRDYFDYRQYLSAFFAQYGMQVIPVPDQPNQEYGIFTF